MKSVAIIKTFDDYPNTNDITIFSDIEFLSNNNFIKRLRLTDNSNVVWYVLGANETGKDRLTPLSYISLSNDSFQFTTDNNETITIDYNTFARVYTQAEINLQSQYKVGEQTKIGIDYLIEVYKGMSGG